MHWYRVLLVKGRPTSAEVVEAPETDTTAVVYALAKSKADAFAKGRAAYNRYCAEKLAERRQRLAEENKCRCGRDRNVPGRKRCAVCLARGQADKRRLKERRAAGVEAHRDEPARVDANRARQRDRREEIRIETLIEVRRRWQVSQTNASFERWLDGEIDAILKRAG